VSETIIAIILGLVEGITEYLPISSTGHLILFNEALQFTGDRAKNFDIVIQLGAILSVLVLFRERFVALLPDQKEWQHNRQLAFAPGMYGVAGIVKLGLVSAPALAVGFLFGKQIKHYLFAPLPVAIALAVGALLILIVESLKLSQQQQRQLEELTWKQSLVIGCVQCLALWPGMSRSASAIIGGMVVGLSRRSAAEFSFLAAVPVLTVAALHDLVEAVRIFSYEDLKLVAIGFVVSFFSALITMRWFIGIVSRWSLRPFAYYRLVVAALVVFLLCMRAAPGGN
jgi:undecaprenyl-diphosphatase